MAKKQIKDFVEEIILTDTHDLVTENVALGEPITKRFSLATLKAFILQGVSSAWSAVTGKPFTSIDTNTLDTTTVGDVVTLKVKEGVYAAASTSSDLTTHTGNADIHTTTLEKATWNGKVDASDLVNKLTQADIIQGDNITLVKNETTNEITISSSVPVGSATTIGGYKVGTNLNVVDGVLSATGEIGGTVDWIDVALKPFTSIDTNTLNVNTGVLEVKDGIFEPVITTKKTAFNLDLGTTVGTVAEGNHTHTDLLSNTATYETLLTTNKTIVGAINENFTSVSNGKTAIASAITAKGVATSNTDTFSTMATNISNISSGGGTASDDWTPNSTWWDIKTILQNDTRSYLGKWICLMPDSDISTVLTVNSNIVAYATSDGAFYTSTTTHTWDITKDKVCNEGYKTRYIIYYSNSASTPSSVSFGSSFVCASSLYIVLDINISYGLGFLQNCSMVQSFDFINNKNFNTTTMVNFCNSASYLQRMPPINTSGVLSFSSFAYGNSNLRILPFIDTSSATGTGLQNFCYSCKALMICQGEISLLGLTTAPTGLFNNCTSIIVLNVTHISKSMNFSYFVNLNHDSLLNILNGLVDLTSLTSQTLTLGATLLGRLTTEEKAIATAKNWVLA